MDRDCNLQMTKPFRVRSLRKLDGGEYEVLVEYLNGDSRSFVCSTDTSLGTLDPIIGWSDEFASFLGVNEARARPIFNAVRAMHNACEGASLGSVRNARRAYQLHTIRKLVGTRYELVFDDGDKDKLAFVFSIDEGYNTAAAVPGDDFLQLMNLDEEQIKLLCAAVEALHAACQAALP